MEQPSLYFRAREGNANIYRISGESRQTREMLTHIGNVVYQSKKVKLNEGEALTPEEEKEVSEWVSKHRNRLNRIQRTRSEALIVEINQMTHWIQTQANDKDVDFIFEEILIAIYDLRQTLVRRYAKSMEISEEQDYNPDQ